MSDDSSHMHGRGPRIKEIAHEAAAACGRLQRHHIKKAEEAGYSKDALQYVGDTIAHIPDSMLPSESESAVAKFRDFVKELERSTSADGIDVASHAYALATTASSTASISVSMETFGSFERREPPKPLFWSPDRDARISERLAQLNPDLATLFQSVRESFLAGVAESERRALYSMRELFDQFFAAVSPDDKVRLSVHFKMKPSPKENQIHRRERILFAANERVKNAALGQALAANAGYFVSIHDRLNEAHQRGQLRRESVQETLRAAIAVIEEWAEALEF